MCENRDIAGGCNRGASLIAAMTVLFSTKTTTPGVMLVSPEIESAPAMPRNDVSFPAATRTPCLPAAPAFEALTVASFDDIGFGVIGYHAHRTAQVDGEASGDAAVDADSLDGIGVYGGDRQSIDRLSFGRSDSLVAQPEARRSRQAAAANRQVGIWSSSAEPPRPRCRKEHKRWRSYHLQPGSGCPVPRRDVRAGADEGFGRFVDDRDGGRRADARCTGACEVARDNVERSIRR